MTLRLINWGDNEGHLFFKTTQRYVMTVEEEETEVEVWSPPRAKPTRRLPARKYR